MTHIIMDGDILTLDTTITGIAHGIIAVGTILGTMEVGTQAGIHLGTHHGIMIAIMDMEDGTAVDTTGDFMMDITQL